MVSFIVMVGVYLEDILTSSIAPGKKYIPVPVRDYLPICGLH